MLNQFFMSIKTQHKALKALALLLLWQSAVSADSLTKATRACMLQYLSCQEQCRTQKDHKLILTCLDRICTAKYKYCIDNANHQEKNQ